MTPTTSYRDYEAARRAYATLRGESVTLASMPGHLRKVMLRLAYSGSGGVIAFDSDYGPFSFPTGSSPTVVAVRPIKPGSETGALHDSLGFRDVLRLSVVDQIQEVRAALSLNKSQLARVLRASRPALYDWLRDREPNAANRERVRALLRCLVRAHVSSMSPLNARFVRQSVDLDGPAPLGLLCEERIDEDRVVSALEQAQALEREANRRKAAREERLRDLGFEDPGREQRREQLARNMALRSWPSR